MRQRSIFWSLLLVLGVGFTAACDDGGSDLTAPDQQEKPITADEQQTLTDALEASGALGPLQGHAGLVIPQATRAGTVTLSEGDEEREFEALGFLVDSDVTDFNEGLTGLIAWNGLDASEGSVDELLVILIPQLLEEGETADLARFRDGREFGHAFVMQHNSPPALFISTDGTFTLSELELGDPEACEDFDGVHVSGDAECTAEEGSMRGSFDFTAQHIPAMNGETIMRAADFDVPAIRVTLRATDDGSDGGTGDGGSLSVAEREALIQALQSSDEFGPLQDVADVVLAQIDNTGTIFLSEDDEEGHEALGFLLDAAETERGTTLTGFLAWNGMDDSDGTIEELLLILVPRVMEEGESADLSQFDKEEGTGQAFVLQPNTDSPPALFISTEGTFTIDVLALGEPQDCEDVDSVHFGGDAECTAEEGTMDGSFDFTAMPLPPNGESISRSSMFEEVPTVRVTVVPAE